MLSMCHAFFFIKGARSRKLLPLQLCLAREKFGADVLGKLQTLVTSMSVSGEDISAFKFGNVGKCSEMTTILDANMQMIPNIDFSSKLYYLKRY